MDEYGEGSDDNNSFYSESDFSLEESTMKNIQNEETKDTKSEYMPRQTKFRNTKRLSFNSGQLKVVKKLTSESFYKNEKKSNLVETEEADKKKNLCEKHNKELDMVCEESSCMTPVCSSCILFGDHKNHQYVQLDAFYENIHTIKENLIGMKNEIQKSKKNFQISHLDSKIFQRMSEYENELKSEIKSNSVKYIQSIKRREENALTDLKYFFENLKIKLEKYSKDSIQYMCNNNVWENNLFSIIYNKEDSPENVKYAFDFQEKVNQMNIFRNGQNLLDKLTQIQNSFKSKIRDCLNSVSIKFNSLPKHLFEINKNEISFENEFKNKMMENNIAPETPTNDVKNFNFHLFKKSSNEIPEIDICASNLMSGLNLITENTIDHDFDLEKPSHLPNLISKSNTLKEIDRNVNYIDAKKNNEHMKWNKNTFSNTGIPIDDEFQKNNMFRCKSNTKFRKSIEPIQFNESKLYFLH